MCPKKRKTEETSVGWRSIDVWSKDRYNGSSHNFSVRLVQKLAKVQAVKLASAHIPALYNIDDTNNQITITESTPATFNVTLTNGGYSLTSGPTTLVSLIQTALNAVTANTYTVTYDQNTYKITIARSAGAVTFQLNWSTNTKTQKIGTMLGFGISDSAAGLTTSTAASVADVSIDDLYLEISDIGTSSSQSAGSTVHWTYLLPLDQNTFQTKNTLFYNTQLISPFVDYAEPRTINHLKVVVKDKWGEIKDFQGAEWSFNLRFLVENDF